MPEKKATLRFEVLHALRVKGFAATSAVAATIGEPDGVVDALLGELRDAELVKLREGRVSGWRLTSAGTVAHADELAAQSGRDGRGLRGLHESFLPLNQRVKALCTAWQLRDGEINDHTVSTYDDGVRAQSALLHADVDQVLSGPPAFDRAGWYRDRLQSAHDRFVAGDGDALARPLSESYHDVWMELHQDLLLSLGLERADADA